jgi:hypothetical protein
MIQSSRLVLAGSPYNVDIGSLPLPLRPATCDGAGLTKRKPQLLGMEAGAFPVTRRSLRQGRKASLMMTSALCIAKPE